MPTEKDIKKKAAKERSEGMSKAVDNISLLNKSLGGSPVQRYNDEAMMAFYRQKLMLKLAEKDPLAYASVMKQFNTLAQDPVAHNSQSRQRVTSPYSNVKLTAEELKQELGENYEGFMEARKRSMKHNFGGLTEKNESQLNEFSMDDMAPMLTPKWESNQGEYYRANYDDKSGLTIDTNLKDFAPLATKGRARK